MTAIVTIVAICILAIYVVIRVIRQSNELKTKEEYHKRMMSNYVSLQNTYDAMIEKYSKYDTIIYAEAEAERILDEAYKKSNELISQTNTEVQRVNADVQQAKISIEKMLQDAQQKTREIAGDALDAKDNAKLYEQTVKSLKNIILGYGNDYLIPSHTLLDDLAETYG